MYSSNPWLRVHQVIDSCRFQWCSFGLCAFSTGSPNIQLMQLSHVTKGISSFMQFLLQWLNSSFFWNWCNVNPDKITKCDQLWFRGFVSIIINPFLRVFAISAFLKVIHAPKTPKRRGISGTPKITFPHIFFQILAIGTSHKLYKHPHVKGFLTK